MAKDELNLLEEKGIIDFPLENLVGDRFGRYAKYIIQERALPDVRDGLKPVQRRILYAMNELGITSDKQHKKSARIVGEVIGKYHPHGDTSVYDALVRMSQSWKLGSPLIDMQGNNGSIDGDSAAAMRYTETRLAKLSGLLLKDLEKNTVLFAPNFDDSEKEPTVLPAYFPNILANGASGIAAGYATNMPPHNLGEIIDATIAMINEPSITLQKISQIVKGPDFPTGGIARGIEGIESAFDTGKGRVFIQSKTHEENGHLVITEIPYEVIKQDLVRKIGEVVDANPGIGVREVRDETDRTGLRIVIELAPETDFELTRKFLFKNTPLQISYNYNNVVIVNKQPMQLGILKILQAYIDHHRETYTKRTDFELAKALKRLEIIEGLIKAISILDEVIAIIRNSANRSEAINNLVTRFEFSEVQGGAIVDLRLYRLTSTDIVKLQEEHSGLSAQIKHYNLILNDSNAMNNEIIKNLNEIKNEFAIPRRTQILDTIESLDVEIKQTLVEKEYNIWISRDGYLKALEPNQIGKFGFEEFKRRPNDLWIANVPATTLQHLILVSSAGVYYSIPVFKINSSKWKETGMHINQIATMNGNEKIIAAFVVNSFENAKQEILVASQNAMIKRTPVESMVTKMFSKAFKIMKLSDGDRLVSASLVTSKTKFVTMVTQNGFSVRYDIEEIPSASVTAKGVKSCSAKDEKIIAGKAFDNEDIVIITNKGNIKKIKPEMIPLMNRPKKGVRLYPWNKKRDEFVLDLFSAQANETLCLLDEEDNLKQLNVNTLKYSDLEEINNDLDMGEIEAAIIEKNYIIQNNDIPKSPRSSDNDSENEEEGNDLKK
ncbi:DNA topoisomerase IV subunit A [Spiroplasma sabaudiense Ar-1343]|uniref:DNA topoisomerase 4 subunit A n=1 Tax=Spiroplasma sabaudiense Ar-1343 TaxID=1276257 RepID=W6A9T4_9MOLU|nr:DNA topoisomerase IV subunit A [Spiroplasma sabaudiense]AHI53938.1 DNA topoisomerase IV subunit A [Spiroplasma sabaudiense Ar-1343]